MYLKNYQTGGLKMAVIGYGKLIVGPVLYMVGKARSYWSAKIRRMSL